MAFIENYKNPLISPQEIIELELIPDQLKDILGKENPSRLHIFSRNFLSLIEERGCKEEEITLFSKVITFYPKDLRIGIMKEIKESYSSKLYEAFLEDEVFIDGFFDSYK